MNPEKNIPKTSSDVLEKETLPTPERNLSSREILQSPETAPGHDELASKIEDLRAQAFVYKELGMPEKAKDLAARINTLIEDQEKEAVPQLDRISGLSHDYINELVLLQNLSHDVLSQIDTESEYDLSDPEEQKDFRTILMHINNKFMEEYPRKLKTYQERFSPKTFSNVVTEENRSQVETLDTIVQNIKDLMPEPITLKNFKEKRSTLLAMQNLIDDAIQLIRQENVKQAD